MPSETFTKTSTETFKGSKTVVEEVSYNLTDLKNNLAIYEAHAAEYQAKAEAIQVLLDKAAEFGIVEKK